MPLDLLVPLIVILLMLVVGTEILPAQLTAAVGQPATLGILTLMQFVLLPLLALAIILLLRPPIEVAGGLLLVAASPGGALSNFYSLLGRLNVALSVTLTAISGLAAVVIMPIALALIAPLALGLQAFAVPIGELALRLVVFLVLPVALGMLIRWRWPDRLQQQDRRIRTGSMGLLLVLLTAILLDQQQTVLQMLPSMLLITLVFTLLALLTGWLIGLALRWTSADSAVLALEFSVRNVGIAAVIALNTFQQPEFAAFGALFLLFQFPLIALFLLGGHRRHSRALGNDDQP